MRRALLSKRFWATLLLLWLPTALLLGLFVLRDLWPGWPNGTARRNVLTFGDYAINTYHTPQGAQYYDLTLESGGHTRVLIDRVYAYARDGGKLYVRGVTGAASAELESGACRLYTSGHYPKYSRSYANVTVVASIKSFPPDDYDHLIALVERYPAFSPPQGAQGVLGCGRFRIETVQGADGFRRLQLIDGQARELDLGYTVRLLGDVQSFSLQDGVLYVRAKEGYACLRAKGEDFTVAYSDYGSKIYFSTMPDIEVVRDLSEFPLTDRLKLQQLWFSGRA